MQVKINLDKADIVKIIAKKYNILTSEIDVHVESKSVGYGPTERMEPTVFASISVSEDKAKQILLGTE